MSAAFQTNLTAMSLLALLVGGFLIYNAMTFFGAAAAQAARHAASAWRQQTGDFFQVMSEALLIGRLVRCSVYSPDICSGRVW